MQKCVASCVAAMALTGVLLCSTLSQAAENRATDSQSAHRAAKAPPFPPFDGFMLRSFSVALGLGGGGLQLDRGAAQQTGSGNPWQLGLGLRVGFLSLLFVDGGFSVGVGRDHRPMTGTLCRLIDPTDCFTAKTQIDATTAYIKGGLTLRYFFPIGAGWTIQTALLPGVGYRGAWLGRKLMCTGCPSESLAVDGGMMLSPELDISLASNEDGASKLGGAFGLRFEYEYFPKADLASTFWIKALIEIL